MFSSLKEGILSLLFPAGCLGCSQPITPSQPLSLCADCMRELPKNKPPWCLGCGCSLANLGAGIERCRACRKQTRPFPFDRVIAPFRYEGVIPSLVYALKYRGRLSLVPSFADWMAKAVLDRMGNDSLDLCAPVPLHPTRFRERTFNQAERLGQALAKQLHLPFRADLLRRKRATLSQTTLDRSDRMANLKGAFELNPTHSVTGLRILLVDDVFTTGATAIACSATLKDHGAKAVVVAVLAHSQLGHSS